MKCYVTWINSSFKTCYCVSCFIFYDDPYQVIFVEADKVRMYEEIMANNDNLESNLPTSSLLKMCCLVQVELCVYCPMAGDVLTVEVLCNLTL